MSNEILKDLKSEIQNSVLNEFKGLSSRSINKIIENIDKQYHVHYENDNLILIDKNAVEVQNSNHKIKIDKNNGKQLVSFIENHVENGKLLLDKQQNLLDYLLITTLPTHLPHEIENINSKLPIDKPFNEKVFNEFDNLKKLSNSLNLDYTFGLIVDFPKDNQELLLSYTKNGEINTRKSLIIEDYNVMNMLKEITYDAKSIQKAFGIKGKEILNEFEHVSTMSKNITELPFELLKKQFNQHIDSPFSDNIYMIIAKDVLNKQFELEFDKLSETNIFNNWKVVHYFDESKQNAQPTISGSHIIYELMNKLVCTHFNKLAADYIEVMEKQ